MQRDRRQEEMRLKIKKLALAFHTGWEYVPESGEAGSVLMDAFCDMLMENYRRFDRMWEKHALEFLSVMPEDAEEEIDRILELEIYANGGCDGKYLAQGTEVLFTPEQGEPLKFATAEPLRLTAAELLYVLYQDGLRVWQLYKKGEKEKKQIVRPVFCWQYENLCNGYEEFRYIADIQEVSGEWSISDGEKRYSLEAQSTDEGLLLWGKTSAFRENTNDCIYKLQLSLSSEKELPEQLCGPMVLKEEKKRCGVLLCLTEEGASGADRVLPFGRALEPASCCYFVCDRILAVKGREITLEFTEGLLQEEKLPQALPEQYRKLYKKYPWLKQEDRVMEWKAEATVWEYFNGRIWLPLPGSRQWNTGCGEQGAGQIPAEGLKRSFRWMAPDDMSACVVEGQEHYYIRLRLERAENAYAYYYRKRIPVLEKIYLSAAQGQIRPIRSSFPDLSLIGNRRVYYGFDREITEENCWYKGDGNLFFVPEAISGWGIRYGRKAFWAETDGQAGAEEKMKAVYLLPNYVRVRQIRGEGENGFPSLKAEAGQLFSVETVNVGVLDAGLLTDVSFADTRIISDSRLFAAAGGKNRGSYPAAFGRLVTPEDISGWLWKRYPEYSMVSCTLLEEKDELTVVLRRKNSPGQEEAREMMNEIEQRLKAALAVESQLWLAGCRVSCVLARPEQGQTKEEEHGEQSNAG